MSTVPADQVYLQGSPLAQEVFSLTEDDDTARFSARHKAETRLQDCAPDLWISFFFDGTRNNYDADRTDLKHSNVVRLWRAHLNSDPGRNLYKEYISGVGTEFRDDITQEVIDKGKDPGLGDTRGAGFAKGGQVRLDWALKRLELRIKDTAKKNPWGSIRKIHLAIFGFSRGAALARAFARQLEIKMDTGRKQPSQQDGIWCLPPHGSISWFEPPPITIYFMGLFDTVASVGTPTSMRKKTGIAGVVSPIGVFFAATADGHGAWASDLRVPSPAFLTQCVHMVSAHELRDSFPLDLVVHEGRTPGNCLEILYPGVHSDVGGGYHPGAQGRGEVKEDAIKLSQIPLRDMFRAAWRAGVPLMNPSKRKPSPARVQAEKQAQQQADQCAKQQAEQKAIQDFLKSLQEQSPDPLNLSLPGQKESAAGQLAREAFPPLDLNGLKPKMGPVPRPPSDPSDNASWGQVQKKDFAIAPSVVKLYNHYLNTLDVTPGAKCSLQAGIVAHMDAYYRWRATVLDQPPPADNSLAGSDYKRWFPLGTRKLNGEFKEDARKAWKEGGFSSPYRRLLARAWEVYRALNPQAPEVTADSPVRRASVQSCLDGAPPPHHQAQEVAADSPVQRASVLSCHAGTPSPRPFPGALTLFSSAKPVQSTPVPDADTGRFFLTLVHDSVADFWTDIPKGQIDDTRLCNPRVFYHGGDERVKVARNEDRENMAEQTA